jgi:hypothetical protein
LSRELSNLLPSASVPGGQGTPNGVRVWCGVRWRVVSFDASVHALAEGRHRGPTRATSVLSIARVWGKETP